MNTLRMKPKLLSLGYTVPCNSYTQDEIFDALNYPGIFRRLFRTSKIEKRHFWVPLDRITKLSWQEQEEQYKDGAIALSRRAIENCLDSRGLDDIGCLVFCSCTGFCPGPTVGHHIAKELDLPKDVYHTNIGSMGCEGGFPGLKRAYDFTLANHKKAIVIACELASCSYFPEPAGRPDPENHYELARSNALFADAASCALVGFDNDPRHPYIIDTETYTDTSYIDDLGYVWRDGRLRVLLSKRVPGIASELASIVVPGLLKRHQLKAKNIDYWVIHAAGSLVLDNIRDALGLPESKFTWSREALKRYGNVSSATVGIIGKLLMENIEPSSGETMVMVSLGPGMTTGATLMQWP